MQSAMEHDNTKSWADLVDPESESDTAKASAGASRKDLEQLEPVAEQSDSDESEDMEHSSKFEERKKLRQHFYLSPEDQEKKLHPSQHQQKQEERDSTRQLIRVVHSTQKHRPLQRVEEISVTNANANETAISEGAIAVRAGSPPQHPAPVVESVVPVPVPVPASGDESNPNMNMASLSRRSAEEKQKERSKENQKDTSKDGRKQPSIRDKLKDEYQTVLKQSRESMGDSRYIHSDGSNGSEVKDNSVNTIILRNRHSDHSRGSNSSSSLTTNGSYQFLGINPAADSLSSAMDFKGSLSNLNLSASTLPLTSTPVDQYYNRPTNITPAYPNLPIGHHKAPPDEYQDKLDRYHKQIDFLTRLQLEGEAQAQAAREKQEHLQLQIRELQASIQQQHLAMQAQLPQAHAGFLPNQSMPQVVQAPPVPTVNPALMASTPLTAPQAAGVNTNVEWVQNPGHHPSFVHASRAPPIPIPSSPSRAAVFARPQAQMLTPAPAVAPSYRGYPQMANVSVAITQPRVAANNVTYTATNMYPTQGFYAPRSTHSLASLSGISLDLLPEIEETQAIPEQLPAAVQAKQWMNYQHAKPTMVSTPENHPLPVMNPRHTRLGGIPSRNIVNYEDLRYNSNANFETNNAKPWSSRGYSYPLPSKPPFCVWLGNIPSIANDENIQLFFQQIGIRTKDIRFGRRQGAHTCCYVDFYTLDDMKLALNTIDSSTPPAFMGRILDIDINEGIRVDRASAVTAVKNTPVKAKPSKYNPSRRRNLHLRPTHGSRQTFRRNMWSRNMTNQT